MLIKFLSIFSDDCGNLSSMRILNFIVILSIMIKYFKTNTLTYEEIGLIIGLLGLKTVQKKFENTPENCSNK